MLGQIAHRGPDAEGIFTNGQVNLGNRRLAIIDLDRGNQPIANETGDVLVVYNGEIYNFPELRRRLEAQGHRFQTHSDTEVLVHLYEEHGLDLAAELNGMFAFALWDQRQQRLVLVRDPVGIKPLCYWWDGRTLVFGSEVKALLKHPAVRARRDPDATHLLLNVRYVPAPRTLFQGVYKLLPGHLLVHERGEVIVRRWWRWDTQPQQGVSADDWADQLRETLRQAVARQMISDVPLGTFLSGGLDSSTITALASQAGGSTLKTFSLGFGEPSDELADARRIAQHFHTEHFEQSLDPQPLRLYPRIVYHVEEPKVNSPQGYYLAQLARQHVKVALSGLGGDELFVGYDLHRYLHWLQRGGAVRGLSRLAGGAVALAAGALDRLCGLRFENFRRGMELVAHLHDGAACYGVLRNAWDLDDARLRRIYTPQMVRQVGLRTRDVFEPYFAGSRDYVGSALWAEFNLKMVDDFLHNEDRVSMAHSLEVRVPLLDREVIELALQIPLSQRFRGGQNKALLKQAVGPLLPPETVAKRKWGFTFNPYYQFKKDLAAQARRVLTAEAIQRQGVFQPRFLQRILDHPPSRLLRWHYFVLWLALGLHYWDEIFLAGRQPEDFDDRRRPAGD